MKKGTHNGEKKELTIKIRANIETDWRCKEWEILNQRGWSNRKKKEKEKKRETTPMDIEKGKGKKWKRKVNQG